jgi:Tol biopolymer transport system component
MRRLAVLLAAVAAGSLGYLGLAQASRTGNYSPPPGDHAPTWSPDGSVIAYTTPYENVGLLDAATGQRLGLITNVGSVVFSPTSKRIAYYKAGSLVVADEHGLQPTTLHVDAAPVMWRRDDTILISRLVGNELHYGSIRPDGTGLEWYQEDVQGLPSSDGTRFLVVNENSTGSRGSLYVVNVDGSAEPAIPFRPAQLGSPAWSPDGTRFVYPAQEGGRTVLRVVSADESVNRVVASSALPWLDRIIWSPTGTALAYTPYGPRRSDFVVVRLPGGVKTFPTIGLGLGGWSPDGRELLYTNGTYGIDPLAAEPRLSLLSLDIATGAGHRIGPAGEDATYSPDGRSIAMASGGECRDLIGIYVMRADGTDRRRLTRDCRVYGTAGDDVLNPKWICCDSNPPYIVLGLAGNDTLYAGGGNPYDGSTLMGGQGNDTLYGSIRGDLLDGGPGDDTIYGGLGADVIIGGPGHDHIYAERGADVVYARDGERDWIDCGRPGDGKNLLDVVYADRIDVVASDCEVVHRG